MLLALKCGESGDAARNGLHAHGSIPVGLITFDDGNGVRWRVWKVETPASQAHLMNADFRTGWLVFEREDELERRRLAQVPEDWDSLPEHRLAELLTAAIPVTTPRSGSTQQVPVTPRDDRDSRR